MKLVIVSGLSGSGKSIVLQVLEDLGFYCIDNLPVSLLPMFAEQMQAGVSPAYGMAAVGVDARNLVDDFQGFPDILAQIRDAGAQCEMLFLDAEDATLIKRFSETRRKHPLTRGSVPLSEAIQTERKLLAPLSAMADLHIDTSRTTTRQLRDLICERITTVNKVSLSLLLTSFGYKHGVPADANLIFDVRCVPNPYWELRLRALTGLDKDVAEFLEEQPLVHTMFNDIVAFLDKWLPYFEAENRRYMTVAIGCTGGQHRSVYMAKRLADHFKLQRPDVLLRHRELS